MPPILLNDFSLFIGRFHPLMVHLPVGILLLAALMEGLSMNKRLARLAEAVPAILMLGFLAALAAVATGYLLADTGMYLPGPLAWHRAAGLALTLLSAGAWLFSIGWIKVPRGIYAFSLLLLIALTAFTGHLGSVLTHGPDYLSAFAPSFLGGQAGNRSLTPEQDGLSHPDSAIVYREIIRPILESKCLDCHGSPDQRGGLDLSSPEHIRQGGDNGDVFMPGSPEESELFTRVTLPRDEVKFMPPSGEPLSYAETRLLAWWIGSGADFEASLADLDKPDDVKALLEKHYGWSHRRPSYVQTAQVQPMDTSDLNHLQEMGFEVERLAQNSYFLSVRPLPGLDSINAGQLDALSLASGQLTWLDLGGVNLDTRKLNVLRELSHLTRLQVDGTNIDDGTLAIIRDLPRLESLNLVGTTITEAALPYLGDMPNLQRVYLWGTGLNEQSLEGLRQARPDLEVVSAFRFADTQTPDGE